MGAYAPFGQVIPVTGLNLPGPGNVSRLGERVIVAKQANPANASAINFGDALVTIQNSTGGLFQSVRDFIAGGGTLTAALLAGFAVREVKTNLTFPQVAGTSAIGSYAAGEMTEALVRGSITVPCLVGTPVVEGPIYIRTATNNAFPAGVVGGVEAAADAGKTVAIPNVVFKTGRLDANNMVEITILTRLSA